MFTTNSNDALSMIRKALINRARFRSRSLSCDKVTALPTHGEKHEYRHENSFRDVASSRTAAAISSRNAGETQQLRPVCRQVAHPHRQYRHGNYTCREQALALIEGWAPIRGQ
jgi:hypothetical protein